MTHADMTRADATRTRLLDAAVAAFAERGFHGTTTRDIAAAAGLSSAALYVHHRSKEELLYLISRSGHEATLELVRAAIRSADQPTYQLIAVIRAFAIHTAREHTSARIVNYEDAALDDEHKQQIRAIRQAVDREVRGLVEHGVAIGEFDTPNPRMAAVALLSLGIDIARWYREDGLWSAEDIAEYYADVALRIVGAHERPTLG